MMICKTCGAPRDGRQAFANCSVCNLTYEEVEAARTREQIAVDVALLQPLTTSRHHKLWHRVALARVLHDMRTLLGEDDVAAAAGAPQRITSWCPALQRVLTEDEVRTCHNTYGCVGAFCGRKECS